MSQNHRPESTAFGAKLKAKREAAGMTQQDLANRLAVHVRHIQRMEAGGSDVPLSRLCQLAQALGQPLWVMVFGLEDVVVMPEPAPPQKRKRKPSLTKAEPEKEPSLALQIIRRQAASGTWDERE